jgi:HEAT repeat protein
MAAAIGLKRMSSQTTVAQALEKIHPDLATLFNLWSKADVPGLKQLYGAAVDLGIRAIVALAMGDIASQSMLSQDAEVEKDALAFLKTAFEANDSTTPLPVRWAVADALAMTDPNWVTSQVVRPAIKDATGRPNGVQEEWLNRDKCLAYLIGLIRSQEPEAQTFLVEHCLKQVHDTRVWITAIAAIGRLANRDSRQLLQSIAMDAFFDQRLEEYIANKNDRLHVRRKALEVLADLGDRGSVQALQDAGLDQDQELFETFYWMTSAVYQRIE